MAGKEKIVNQADQATEKHRAEAGHNTQAQRQSRDPRQRQLLTLVAVHRTSTHRLKIASAATAIALSAKLESVIPLHVRATEAIAGKYRALACTSFAT